MSINIDEYAGYLKGAIAEADIQADDDFCRRLAAHMEDALERHEVEIEASPQDAMDFMDSEAASFDEFMMGRIDDFGLDEEVLETWKYAIEYAMKDGDFNDDIAEKVKSRSGEIASALMERAPFPDISLDYGRRTSFRCNICVGTGHSANYMFDDTDNIAQYILEEDPLPVFPDHGKGGLAFLMQTQDASLDDAIHGEGKFVKSLRKELMECCGQYGSPTFLVTLDMKDLEAIKDGESIRIDPGVVCGIVELYNGGGGTLDIELEKPVVLNKDFIYELQIEGAKNWHYSVDSIYGLASSCWDSRVGITDEKPMEPKPFDIQPDNRQAM